MNAVWLTLSVHEMWAQHATIDYKCLLLISHVHVHCSVNVVNCVIDSYLSVNPDSQLCSVCTVECRRILELGSGSGFLGSVICSVCFPSSFTFSDCHDDVIELLLENVHRNLRLTGHFDTWCMPIVDDFCLAVFLVVVKMIFLYISLCFV